MSSSTIQQYSHNILIVKKYVSLNLSVEFQCGSQSVSQSTFDRYGLDAMLGQITSLHW